MKPKIYVPHKLKMKMRRNEQRLREPTIALYVPLEGRGSKSWRDKQPKYRKTQD